MKIQTLYLFELQKHNLCLRDYSNVHQYTADIRLLASSFSVLKRFLLGYITMEAMRFLLSNESKKKFAINFLKKIVPIQNKILCLVYTNDTRNLLCTQVSGYLREEFVPSLEEAHKYLDTMNYEIETNACPAVE